MEIKLIYPVYKMDELMKRGGKAKRSVKSKTIKQKQKQSVVIKNVINIGERKKKMNKRQKRARTQPQQQQPFIPQAQYPLQRLFQPQQQIYRSVSMSSANASEANNNVSKVVDATQKISDGKVVAEIDNKLEKAPFTRLLEGLDNPFLKKKLVFDDVKSPMSEPKKERKARSDYGVKKGKRRRILPEYNQVMEEKMIDKNILDVIQEKRSSISEEYVKQKADELMATIHTTGERNQQYLNDKILEAKNKDVFETKNKYNRLKEDE